MSQITVHELKEILNQNASNNFIVLDVRTNAEHDSKRIPGVYNLPLDELEEHLEMLKKYDKVYLHCQSGNRSGKGYQRLLDLGLTNVVNVTGGIGEWEQNSFGVKTNNKMPIIQQVMIVAGSLVLFGSIFSFVSPIFALISIFAGGGLVYAGVSGNCLMAKILGEMPWNQVKITNLPWQKN
jgi:rhodanese-related sulfurtransferase